MVSGTKILCVAAVAVIAGMACCTCFALCSSAIGGSSEVLSIINILILSVVFLVICATGAYHCYEITQRKSQASTSHRLNLNRCTSVVTHVSDVALDVCSICLVSLLEGHESILRMSCCSKQLHAGCFSSYCSTYLDSHHTLPSCVFCRGLLEISIDSSSAL